MRRVVGPLLVALSLCVSLVVASPGVQAQSVIYIDSQIAAHAESVVNGTVLTSISVELDGTPYTVQQVQVDAVVAGTSTADTVSVVIAGGLRGDGTTILLSESAAFLQADETVQLALTPADAALGNAIQTATFGTGPLYTIVEGDSGVAGLSPTGAYVARAASDFAFNGFDRPDFEPPAEFRINAAGSGLSAAATISAVRAGFNRWENDPLSSVDFEYGGTSGLSGLQFGNGHTNVSWQTPNNANALGGSLAIAHLAITGNVYEFEVVMNRNYTWTIGSSFGRYDIETVMAHEVGHGLGLSHVNANSELMFPTITVGSIKELGAGDLAGARQLYPDPTGSAVAEPGHSVAANASGQLAIAAVKLDGRLQVRRDLGNGLSGWTTLGASDWVSADIDISPSGIASVVGIKQDGRMFTRRWATNGTWSGWVQHSGVWDGTSMPSIAMNSNKTVISGINTSGQFRTRVRTSSWGSFVTHGQPGWVHGDVDIAADGDIWFVAVKADGRLYVRKNIAGSWSGFAKQGLATWSTTTSPAIAANSGGAVYGAVKTDGRLYTRRQLNGVWRGYARQGLNSWASVDVALSETGVAWLAAEKTWGRLYVREATAGDSWLGWSKQGLDTWSTHADPSITIGASSRPSFFAVKDSGKIYLRQRTGAGWANWVGDASSDWAPGY